MPAALVKVWLAPSLGLSSYTGGRIVTWINFLYDAGHLDLFPIPGGLRSRGLGESLLLPGAPSAWLPSCEGPLSPEAGLGRRRGGRSSLGFSSYTMLVTWIDFLYQGGSCPVGPVKTAAR